MTMYCQYARSRVSGQVAHPTDRSDGFGPSTAQDNGQIESPRWLPAWRSQPVACPGSPRATNRAGHRSSTGALPPERSGLGQSPSGSWSSDFGPEPGTQALCPGPPHDRWSSLSGSRIPGGTAKHRSPVALYHRVPVGPGGHAAAPAPPAVGRSPAAGTTSATPGSHLLVSRITPKARPPQTTWSRGNRDATAGTHRA